MNRTIHTTQFSIQFYFHVRIWSYSLNRALLEPGCWYYYNKTICCFSKLAVKQLPGNTRWMQIIVLFFWMSSIKPKWLAAALHSLWTHKSQTQTRTWNQMSLVSSVAFLSARSYNLSLFCWAPLNNTHLPQRPGEPLQITYNWMPPIIYSFCFFSTNW